MVTIAVDRAKGCSYQQNYTINNLPTLTTNSGSLMILDVGGVVDKAPDSERQFMRFVRNNEKLAAQGFSPKVHLSLSSQCPQKASGNAYPVPLIIAVLHPIVNALGQINLAQWPPHGVRSTSMPPMSFLNAVMKEFAKPCKRVSGKTAKYASARKKTCKDCNVPPEAQQTLEAMQSHLAFGRPA